MRQKRAYPTLFWPLAFLKRPALRQLQISILAKSERSSVSVVLNYPRDVSHSARRCYWRRSVPGLGPRSERYAERRGEPGAVIPGRVNIWAELGQVERRAAAAAAPTPSCPLCLSVRGRDCVNSCNYC